MFGAKKKDHDIIEVAFHENDAAKPFSTSKIPIDQLPDTFEINTNLQIGDDEWRVNGSKPSKKIKFRKSGTLQIFLSKTKPIQMDPKDILFSLPTINDELPALEKARSLENAIIFLEGDWRQREFISCGYKDAIEQETAAIHEILENHNIGSGFDKIHIRNAITAPLNNKQITHKTLKKSFEIVKTYEAVAFNTAAASLVGGFAYHTNTNWVLWGNMDEKGIIQILNIFPTNDANAQGMIAIIDSFAANHNLYLVDWPRLFCTDGK